MTCSQVLHGPGGAITSRGQGCGRGCALPARASSRSGTFPTEPFLPCLHAPAAAWLLSLDACFATLIHSPAAGGPAARTPRGTTSAPAGGGRSGSPTPAGRGRSRRGAGSAHRCAAAASPRSVPTNTLQSLDKHLTRPSAEAIVISRQTLDET